ncbi:MAG: GtrA family protein [Gammaproteobacteria bacterium]|nr:GtrA family protein [Gammaproteobacteria bacterium]
MHNLLISKIKNKKSARQLLIYGLVGVASNFSAYMAYLLITYSGGTPKITMSVLYVTTAMVSYYGNRKLTFEHKGCILKSGLRFFLAHCLGYFINLCMLFFLVDKLGYPHQWVQILAIIVVAAFLFITFKIFVFKEPANENIDN